MKVAAAVVSWNGAEHIQACLAALLEQTACPDILVIDNASDDETVALARGFAAKAEQKQRRLQIAVQPANLGYTAGANTALRSLLAVASPYDVIALINQDVTLEPTWLSEVTSLISRSPRVGVVGSRLLYPDRRTLQHAGGYLTAPRLLGLHHGHHDSGSTAAYDLEREVDFVTGAAIALRVEPLRTIGVFDELFGPGYYEDVDLCVRFRSAGWQVVYCPTARATHVESSAFKRRPDRLVLSHRNRLFFAFDRLADPSFAAEFVRAETAALKTEPTLSLRALGLAYLQVLVRLDEAARARLAPSHRTPGLIHGIGAGLLELRAAALCELRRRRAIA
jgi:GT2 family glycosyltransferase